MIQVKKSLHFSSYLFLAPLSMWLSSCAVYKQQFDCPPPAGISCASVTEIEKMIAETEKGADILVKPEVDENNHCFWCGQQKAGYAFPSKNSICHNRVWICNQKKEECSTKGYYFQQSDLSISYSDHVFEPEEFFSSPKLK